MREKGASRSICMVCDFFYPQLGGVENHIWSLSQRLLARGHKVVVVTHAYGRRQGVRYMANGLKVYYLPLKPIVAGTIMPSFIAMYPLLRQILIRERIAIVHGHQVGGRADGFVWCRARLSDDDSMLPGNQRHDRGGDCLRQSHGLQSSIYRPFTLWIR
jgi:glycosyltransferase involved in cell wall biosynthesis